MAKTKLTDEETKLTDEEMLKIIRTAWKDFQGDLGVFMSAVGALVLGVEVGWQAVRVCMAASTYRKYEKILGGKRGTFRFRDVLPKRGKDARRVNGIRMADSLGKFWQALSGGMIPALEGKQTAPST